MKMATEQHLKRRIEQRETCLRARVAELRECHKPRAHAERSYLRKRLRELDEVLENGWESVNPPRLESWLRH